MMINHGLQTIKGVELVDKGRYQRLLGKLIHLSHIRPDIAYAIGVVSRFIHQPHVQHMNAITRILRYLKGTIGRGVLFKRGNDLEIEAHTDADWVGNPNDRKSTSGYFSLVGGNIITWRSKKQKVIALSSAEAEFRDSSLGICEVLWIRKLLIKLIFNPKRTCRLFCDNRAFIKISDNPV